MGYLGMTGMSGMSGMSGISRKPSGPTYTRTAFVSSSGNNATAALNDPTKPYQTIYQAALALYDADASAGTNTVALQSTIGTADTIPFAASSAAANLQFLLDGVGLYTVTDLGISSPSVAGEINVALKDVTITNLYTDQSAPSNTTSDFGVIDLQGSVTVGTLTLNVPGAPQAGAGATNPDSGPVYGSSGSNGSDNDFGPGGDGNPGETISVTASSGGDGETGRGGWSATLNGGASLTSAAFTWVISQGTQGGNGGNGSSVIASYGGSGGNGGNATDTMAMGNPANGGNGGAGGDCYATGGNGGNGGNGGDGGIITLAGVNKANITIGTSVVNGGFGGGPGTGGTASGNGGSGGTPGTGVNGGSDGSYGSSGNGFSTNGGDGSMGLSGNDGQVL